MKEALLVLFLFILTKPAFSQYARHWLAQKVHDADTILLVSHLATGDAIDPVSKRRNMAPLLIGGRPNESQITEKIVLTRDLRDSLCIILTAIYELDDCDPGLCFFPQQAIIFLKNGRGSYIDLCFHCENYSVSDDMKKFNEILFGRKKWTDLKALFIRRGLKDHMNQ